MQALTLRLSATPRVKESITTEGIDEQIVDVPVSEKVHECLGVVRLTPHERGQQTLSTFPCRRQWKKSETWPSSFSGTANTEGVVEQTVDVPTRENFQEHVGVVRLTPHERMQRQTDERTLAVLILLIPGEDR